MKKIILTLINTTGRFRNHAGTGTYIEVGPRGGHVPDAREVTIDRGDRLPPTQKPNRGWVRK